MNFWRISEQFVNRTGGRTAEHVDVEFFPRPAHEGQTHHGIAEMVEFDNEEAGFHRANQRRLSR